MTDHLTPYGFTYGPGEIERLCHVKGRGYALRIKTDHAELQVLISEKGYKLTAYPVKHAAWKWDARS